MALAPPLLPEEEAGLLSAHSLSTGSWGWLLPQAALGFTHLPADSLVLQPPHATFTHDNKGLKSSQRCHLDHLDQRWTTERHTMMETYQAVSRGRHQPRVATEHWNVASGTEEPKFPF